MRNIKKIMMTICVLVAVINIVPRVTDADNLNEKDLIANAENLLKKSELPYQNLKLVSTEEDAYGASMVTFENEVYSYIFNKDDDTLRMVYMLPEKQEAIQNGKISVVSKQEAEDLFYKYINNLFGQYDKDSLTYTLAENEEDYSEYYKYFVEEILNDTVLNRAEIYLSADGQLTYAGGTHNVYKISTYAKTVNEQMVIDNIYTYILSEKEEIEQSQENIESEAVVYSDEESEKQLEDDTTMIATDDMVLPDGVTEGDEFKSEDTLPDFNFLVDDKDDLEILSARKDATSGTVLWIIECRVNTTWGTYDDVFNYIGSFSVDAKSGKIVDVEWTDGNES